MPASISAPLRQFFISELRTDPNATLDLARVHLRDFYNRGPDDQSINSSLQLLNETEELLNMYHPHKQLSDLVQTP